MIMIRLRRSLCIAVLLAAPALPACAQSSFSPSNVICGVVNFQFCDQGAPASPPPSEAAPNFVPPPDDQRAEAIPPEPHKTAVKHKKAHIKKAKPKTPAPDKAAD